jgi:hypothetical protein
VVNVDSVNRGDFVSNFYDDIFKSYKDLDTKLFVLLINGLFGVDFSLDSSVEFLDNESVHYGKDDDGSGRKSSDIVVKIEDSVYHLEFQTSRNDEMILRVFEYAYRVAYRRRVTVDGVIEMVFPRSKVISFTAVGSGRILRVIFPDGSKHEFMPDNFTIFDKNLEEFFENDLVLLAPFHLARWRGTLKKNSGDSRVVNEIRDEILVLMGRLQEYCDFREISFLSMSHIQMAVGSLYDKLYSNNDLFKEVNKMIAERNLLPFEVRELEFKKRVAEEVTKEVTEEVTKEVTKEVTREVTKEVTKETSLRIAKKLLDLGSDLDVIASATGLPMDELSMLSGSISDDFWGNNGGGKMSAFDGIKK